MCCFGWERSKQLSQRTAKHAPTQYILLVWKLRHGFARLAFPPSYGAGRNPVKFHFKVVRSPLFEIPKYILDTRTTNLFLVADTHGSARVVERFNSSHFLLNSPDTTHMALHICP